MTSENQELPPVANPTPSSQETSLTLLQRLRGGDQQAWWRLVYLYEPLVEQWSRRWQFQPDDINDVCQEVFLAVALRIEDFQRDRPGDSFRGWLWTIARNKISDHLRRRIRERNLQEDSEYARYLQNLPEQIPAEDNATERGLLERARNLIRSEFEERTWQMFWRAAVEGHPTDVIAADFGITPNGVRLARSRVQRRLQEELGEWDA